MEYLQTTCALYRKKIPGYCIAAIKVNVHPEGYHILIAWAHEDEAKKGRFAFFESHDLCPALTDIVLERVMEAGKPIPKKQVRKLFPELF